MSRKGEFAMNLVCHYSHAVAQADFTDVKQFVACPHSSCRVVRVAEQQQLRFGLGTFTLEVFEVDVVSLVLIDQTIRHNLTAVVADGGEETIVDRALNDDLVTRSCECLDNGGESGHDT